MVGVPLSASVAVVEQARDVEVVTPVLGSITTVARTGSVFSTVTVALATDIAPSSSVAVASQVTSSPGETELGVKVRLAPEPSVDPVVLLLQV